MQIIIAFLGAVSLSLLSCECFRVLQSGSYKIQRGYYKIFLTWYFASIAAIQIGAVFLAEISEYICISIEFAVGLFWLLLRRKTRLVFTKRIVRMLTVTATITFILCYYVGNRYFIAALPILVILAYLVCLPIDKLIEKYYLRKAVKKLRSSIVKVIAITGSYGKTSVKEMLASLLEKSVSPKGSCNTPLGIAKFINSTDLSKYNYVILEFGARRNGDISQLCNLFKPTYGIITGVCAQHLSTFKSLDRIVQTKRELAEGLPAEGICVLNAHDDIVRKFCNSGVAKKILSTQDLTVSLKKVDFNGSYVNLQHKNRKSIEIHFPQISEHTTDIAEMCFQMCMALNQDLDTTISHIDNIKQAKHRQELSFNGNFYILDDSYNASIIGVESCSRTLKRFSCSKVVISQGIVECGKERKTLNERCGELLGKACDVVIVLGKNKKYLSCGALRAGGAVVQARNLDEAVRVARKYVNGGILLFQNDLPDVVNI